MKIVRFTIVTALATSLMACATSQDRDENSFQTTQLQSRYMTTVDNQARNYATRVHWVNPPSQKTLAARYGIDDEED